MQPSLNDVIARLARQCARGHRQLGFVNELLADAGYGQYEDVYFHGRQQRIIRYGDSRLPGGSWLALSRRLVSAGFIIKYDRTDRDNPKVQMRFSV